MLLFDRRVRNDNGDVTRVSYYCKDLKNGEETLLGTLNRMYYEPTDSAEAVIGSHVYRMIPLGNWWNMPDKDAELALYDFDLNAKIMQRIGTENYRVTRNAARGRELPCFMPRGGIENRLRFGFRHRLWRLRTAGKKQAKRKRERSKSLALFISPAHSTRLRRACAGSAYQEAPAAWAESWGQARGCAMP